MKETDEAVALALSFVDGMGSPEATQLEDRARALLEHLARQGFIVRKRERRERARLGESTLDARKVTRAGLRATREALGLSRSALAERAGVSTSVVEKIEDGTGAPQDRTVTAVLNALAQAEAERHER